MRKNLGLGWFLSPMVPLALLACSTPIPSTDIGTAGSPSSAGAASGGISATAGAATTAGQPTSGSSAGGAPGEGGAQASGGNAAAGVNGGGASGSSTGGSGGSNDPGPFNCTLVLGSLLTNEWWGAGFEDGVDNAKWELKWHHHGNVTLYSNVDSPFWLNQGDPNNDAQGSPILSKCASGEAPDRVLFYAIDWDYQNEQQWIDGLTTVLANIKLKYPSTKWVDLMNEVRCPNNQTCNPNAKYGPGANADGAIQDCYVQPYVDTAMAKIAAMNPHFVGLGPKPEMAACNPAHAGARMTADGNSQAAKDIAAFYKE